MLIEREEPELWETTMDKMQSKVVEKLLALPPSQVIVLIIIYLQKMWGYNTKIDEKMHPPSKQKHF